MGATFQQRRLRITFRLASGSFLREGDPDTVTYEDFRTQCEIDAPGGYQFATCRLRIYGIDYFDMERLTVINYQNLDFWRNVLIVEATDSDGEFSTIFYGEIYTSQPQYDGAPEVPLVVEARSGLVGSLAASNANSYPGAQKVSVIMSKIASELGVTLENNGVESTVTDMYLAGTPLDKAQKLAEAADIQMWYLPEQGVLAIAPPGVSRGQNVVNVNLSTGLIGWPVKNHVGVQFTYLFNPAIFHGCPILLESDVGACNGEWYIVSMSHRLESQMPGGAWFTYFVATPANVTIRSR